MRGWRAITGWMLRWHWKTTGWPTAMRASATTVATMASPIPPVLRTTMVCISVPTVMLWLPVNLKVLVPGHLLAFLPNYPHHLLRARPVAVVANQYSALLEPGQVKLQITARRFFRVIAVYEQAVQRFIGKQSVAVVGRRPYRYHDLVQPQPPQRHHEALVDFLQIDRAPPLSVGVVLAFEAIILLPRVDAVQDTTAVLLQRQGLHDGALASERADFEARLGLFPGDGFGKQKCALGRHPTLEPGQFGEDLSFKFRGHNFPLGAGTAGPMRGST